MKMIRLNIARIIFLVLAALAAVLVLKEAVLPGMVRRKLVSAVRENCKTCEVSVGRVGVSLLPFGVSGSLVHFTGGEANATVVDVEAGRVYIPLSLFPLLKGRLRAGRIEIEGSTFTVTEGDLYASPSAEAGKARPFDVEIKGVRVKEAAFVYIREYPGRKGRIGVSRINAEIGLVGNSARLLDADVEGSASGVLEESGKFRLQVRAKLFSKAQDVDVNLRLDGQDLSKLNSFFQPNDGVQLKGLLMEGRASSEIRGARIKSAAYARYSGLSVKIKKTEERGAFSAFFQNLLASVTIGKQNVEGGDYDRSGAAALERKPKETIISFALRGMKEAGMQVSVQGGK